MKCIDELLGYKCPKFDQCIILCDEAKKYVDPEAQSKQLTSDELIDFMLYTLTSVGLPVWKILQGGRMISRIPKSTAYRRIVIARERGPALVDYFMSNKGMSFQEVQQ